MTAPDSGLCEYCRLLTTTGWGGPDCCETCASHAPGLTECTCPTINAEGLTAPDPGLTDLIAAHRLHTGLQTQCECGINVSHEERLGADPQGYEIAWAAKLRWQARAEKAEAAVDRVRAVEAEYLDPEDADIECREDVWRFIRDLRTALEGEQQ